MNKIIDISEHNGVIDFSKVKNEVSGIIIRLGWIGNKQNHTLDKMIDENIMGCIENNIPYGFYVYNYCNSIETLKQGLKWTIEQIESRKISFELPIFLDMEDSSINNELTEQCQIFCNELISKGYKAGVYANKYWFLNKLDIKKLLDFKIWLAEWNNNNNHSLGYKVDLWQYTDKDSINGINTKVDSSRCLCKCEENNEGDVEEMKIYQNGSTKEAVYSDTNKNHCIGYLNSYEKCDCLGIFNNRAIVRYKVDGTENYKIGFVEWLGGVK